MSDKKRVLKACLNNDNTIGHAFYTSNANDHWPCPVCGRTTVTSALPVYSPFSVKLLRRIVEFYHENPDHRGAYSVFGESGLPTDENITDCLCGNDKKEILRVRSPILRSILGSLFDLTYNERIGITTMYNQLKKEEQG